MCSSNAFNNRCAFRFVNVHTPEWTRVAPKSAQDSHKIAPTWPEMPPNCAQVALESSQKSPKLTISVPKTPPK